MAVTITTKGFIEVLRDGGLVSRHRVETEAIESALTHAEAAGPGTYTFRYPDKQVLITAKVDIYPPPAPPLPVATVLSAVSIRVDWSAVSDPNGIAVYRVERSTSGGAFVEVFNGPGLTFTDTGLTAATSYRYRVCAVDGEGYVGNFSTIVTAVTSSVFGWTIPDTPYALGNVTVGNTIDLSAYASTGSGSPAYTLVSGPSGMTVAQSTGVVSTTGVAAGAYSFTVDLSNLIVQVTGLAASGTYYNLTTLSWSAVPYATSYHVEQSTDGTTWTQIANPTETTYVVTGLAESTSYQFRVRGTNGVHHGAYSATVAVTTTAIPVAGTFEPAITGEPQIAEADLYRTADDTTTEKVGGVTWSHYYRRLGLRWENPGYGDYTGTTAGVDVAQGGSPFSTGAVASGTAYKTFDVTALVTRAVTTGVNKGFYGILTGSSASVFFAGRLNVNPPLLSVTTTTGTFSCPCILSVPVVYSDGTMNTLPVNGTTRFSVSSSRRGIWQFDLSAVTGTVQSATMSLYADEFYGSNRALNLYELRPPRFQLGIGSITSSAASIDGVTGVPENTIATGLAAEVGENNLAAADGTPLHADVYCAGHFEGTTFPNSSSAVAPRLNWGTITRTNTVEIVPDPEAPGTSYWRGTANNVVPGSTGRGLFKRFFDFTPADMTDSLYPIDVTKKVEEVYVRAYFMWEPDFLDMTEGMKCGIGIQLQYGYWVPTSSTTGYWQPYGGNSNSYGDGMKHLGDCHDVSSTYGPSPYPGDSYYFHNDRATWTYKGCMQFNLCGVTGLPSHPHRLIRPFQGYNYNIDATDVFGQGQSVLANKIPVRFQLGRWYCWEQYVKMNTLDFDQPILGAKDGSFYDNYEANPDGIHRTWINGVLVDEKTNFRWRRNMDMGVDAAGIEWYFGGNNTTSLAAPMHFRINHVVVSKRYIGPRVKP